MSRRVERVLVVEDHESLRRTLVQALQSRYPDVRASRTVAEVVTTIIDWTPDLIVLDFALPDGDARSVLDLASLRQPAPEVIAVSGAADPIDTFELAQRGVRAFLPKPLSLDSLFHAIDAVLSTTPAIEPHLRHVVGHRALSEVTDEVRSVMIDEALARSSGNRRAAARILATSRQLLQYLLRRR